MPSLTAGEIETERQMATPISEVLAGGDDTRSRTLHTRTYKRLEREGITTIGRLCQMTEGDLRSFSNFGDQGLNIVKAGLSTLGLTLKPDPS